MRSPSLFCLRVFVTYIYCSGAIIPLHLNYIFPCIDMFVHHVMVSELIYLCMVYYLIVSCTSSWLFCPISVLCKGYSFTVLLLHSSCINMYFYVIYMFTVVCWCTSNNLLLGCTIYWGSYYAYFLYMIIYAIVTILIDFHSQKWINISLFGLVVTSVKRHILVPYFLIYHIFPYIIRFLCCLLIFFSSSL